MSPFGEAPIDGCAANGTITLNQRINCFAATVPGTYYLGYKINDENEVAECNTNNNGIFYWTITVTAGPPPLAFKHTGQTLCFLGQPIQLVSYWNIQRIYPQRLGRPIQLRFTCSTGNTSLRMQYPKAPDFTVF